MVPNPLQLLLYKTYADLKSESERNHAGFLWWFLEPLLNMAIYYVVFAVFFKHHTPNYVPFLLIGLITWRWFQVAVTQGSGSIIVGKKLMQQLYVPKILFPAVSILANSYKFLMTFLVLLVFLWIYGLTPNKAYFALPMVFAVQLLFIIGCTLILASVMPFMPDLRIVVENMLRAMVYLTGIFYSPDIVPEHLRGYFYLNPMACLLQAYRRILIEGQWPDFGHLSAIALLALFFMYAGKRLMRYFDYRYPKVI